MKKILMLGVVLCSLITLSVSAQERPRLVIQIVVGSLRPDDIARYEANAKEGGFAHLKNQGTTYTQAAYGYQQTLTPTALATLTTGALPTTHGVVSSRWYNYIDNQEERLIDDKRVAGLEYHTGGGQFSPRKLVAPTLSETLMEYSPQSRVVTIALEPESAVVMGGKAGYTFWMNEEHCQWRSSSFYMPQLPEWVMRYNNSRSPQGYLMSYWATLNDGDSYLNRRCGEILMSRKSNNKSKNPPQYEKIALDVPLKGDYDRMRYTPSGCTATLNFAKQAIVQLALGKDEHPDLLNIYLDTPRNITEAYGPESVEAEDMFYRLDRELKDLISFACAQVKEQNVAIILTSDHGTSPSFDRKAGEQDRFNVQQFEMLLESFLDARYGKCSEDWVLGYEHQMVWLNHNLIYANRLSLSDVQNEAATFAMQFRGVSHALSATAMRTSYFGQGYAEKMQNSFYPRRSGDVILNLMPGWIEKRDRARSSSGSMYGYDRRVPLIISLPHAIGRTDDSPVEMESVAPTVAEILGIPSPVAAEAEALEW